MSLVIYEKAKKRGDKAYKAAVANGRHPYLLVLDDIISKEDIRGDVSLGLVDVPLDRVVGTSTAARTEAFAENFMPIMPAQTEFAVKWSQLCDAHLAEGIHDPIRVYEYLNYYYVIEGNKRVSVLKYFGADSVPAFVTRKVPKLTDDPEIRRYYAFMDFYRKTKVNFIWFSRDTSFGEMIRLVGGKQVQERKGQTEILTSATTSDSPSGEGTAVREEAATAWNEETYREFKAAYFRFAREYKAAGGGRLQNITTGDAFLSLIHLETFPVVSEMSAAEMKKHITSMWQEFLVANQNDEVEVSLTPPENKKSLLSHIFGGYSESHPLKVAFIYDREPVSSDWLYQHELGRNHIKEVFGAKISTVKVTAAGTEEEAEKAMEDLIRNQGVEVIFTATPRLIDVSLKTAIRHPEIRILNCSLNTSHRYIRTYYTRLYEVKFLSGMVAGIMTETGRIGYLADYPIFGMTANINAFALGAKMVNPRVKVSLKWSTLKDAGEPADLYRTFRQEGVDYLSDQDMITPKQASRRFGMYRLTEGEPVNMSMSVNNWGIFYEKLIRIILNGAWDSTDSDEESKPINYWWGLSAGVTDFIMSDKVPEQTRRLVSSVGDLIRYGRLSPFSGELRSQDFMIRNARDREMQTDEIITMDWLADNVDGRIPKMEELRENARQIVMLKGVNQAKNEDTDNSGH